MPTTRVVIVGGGFGGLTAAQTLRKAPVEIILIDRQNYHLFQPLLYQVATAGLSPAEIAAPIRGILGGQPNLRVLLDEVVGIDATAKTVQLSENDPIPYDLLILATGARHSYFNHPEWESIAPGLKSLDDATQTRTRILLAFERAEAATDAQMHQAWLNFVIVGAGPTGVELAGAIAELSRRALAKDFDHTHPAEAKITLVEAGPRVLASFPEPLSELAQRDLEQMGVTVLTNTRVTGIDEDGVDLSTGRLEAKTVLWAAGVRASAAAQWLGVEPGPNGRVRVDPFLRVPGFDDVYVIGDTAYFEQGGQPLPGVSPVAMQQARYVARRIRDGKSEPFVYADKGSMATIGRGKAVAVLGNLRLGGLIAWLLWLFVHIYYLIGFKNKVFVLFQWAWAYFTFKRGARLITGFRPGRRTAQ